MSAERGGYRLPVRVPPVLWDSLQLGVVLVAVAVLVVLTLRDSRRTRAWARGLVPVMVLAILAVTMLGPPAGSGHANLVPGRMIYEDLIRHANGGLSMVNVVGNVIMFVPLGWLLALVTRRRLLAPVLLGAALSVAIETVQAFIGRAPDIDDVILNTTGAAVGALIAVALLRLRRPLRPGLPAGA